jgi:hypothetical protein
MKTVRRAPPDQHGPAVRIRRLRHTAFGGDLCYVEADESRGSFGGRALHQLDDDEPARSVRGHAQQQQQQQEAPTAPGSSIISDYLIEALIELRGPEPN